MNDLTQKSAQNYVAYFQKYRTNLKPLSELNPHILYIGCLDCRVAPEVMFDISPGEMFVLRLPGAMIPPQGLGDMISTGAVEMVLRLPSIREVIICGHTDCRFVRYLAEDQQDFSLSHISRLIAIADFVRAQASTKVDKLTNPNSYLQALLEHLVQRSLQGLREIEIVRRRETAQEITLHGWYVDLSKGQLFALDEQKGVFSAVNAMMESSADSISAENAIANPSITMPESVAPPPVPTPSSAPPPVEVPSPQPVQRVYASEVITKPAAPEVEPETPESSAARLMARLLQEIKTPARRSQLRVLLNRTHSHGEWLAMKQIIGEFRDPEVRQALRELSLELNNAQSRRELLKIISQTDLSNIDVTQIQKDFVDILDTLRKN